MENYQQNTMNCYGSKDAKKRNYVPILILIEYIIVILGIIIVFISMPTWGQIKIGGTFSVGLSPIDSYIAIAFFFINPIAFSVACSLEQKKYGAKGKTLAITLITTLLPIICLIIWCVQLFDNPYSIFH